MAEPKAKPHYVNNKEFSQAVMDYAVEVRGLREKNKDIPKVTDYIARCFMKISEGLSHGLAGVRSSPEGWLLSLCHVNGIGTVPGCC